MQISAVVESFCVYVAPYVRVVLMSVTMVGEKVMKMITPMAIVILMGVGLLLLSSISISGVFRFCWKPYFCKSSGEILDLKGISEREEKLFVSIHLFKIGQCANS